MFNVLYCQIYDVYMGFYGILNIKLINLMHAILAQSQHYFQHRMNGNELETNWKRIKVVSSPTNKNMGNYSEIYLFSCEKR